MNCIVCGRVLKDPKTAAAGVGPKCAKKLKLDKAAMEEILAIRGQGMDCKILDNKTIQILLLGSEPDPESEKKIKWKYPKGVK